MITYSIPSYNSKGELVPSWITINNLGVLKINAPSVTTTTNYTFYVDSKILNADFNIELEVTLQINKCTVNSCKICKSNSTTIYLN